MNLKTCYEILVLELLEIIVVSKVLAVVVFITVSNCRYNINWKSLSRKESDDYALNKIIFHGFAVIRLIRFFILA